MKITKIAPVIVNANMRNWIFVKVETDEPGLYGWGEATLEWKTRTVAGAIEDISQFLIGEDPCRIEHLYQMMYRQYFWKVGIEGMSAISGIEQALWDIKGKWLNVPVYELLGGRVRDRVRVYNHLGGGLMTHMYETTEANRFAELALMVKEAGYSAIKFMAVPRTEPIEGVRSVRYAEGLVRAVREAVGPEMDLMVDLHARTWPGMAIQYCQAFEPYGLLFFEEPCPTEDIEATAQVTRVSRIPIATGERLLGIHEFQMLLERRACQYVRARVCVVGGISGSKKVAALAEAHHKSVIPHNPLSPVSTAACLQVAASIPNLGIQELPDHADKLPDKEIVRENLRVEDGFLIIPDAPGIGIELAPDAAEKHPYRMRWVGTRLHEDGSVVDQ